MTFSFADDTTLVFKNTSYEALINMCNGEQNLFHSCSILNRLSFICNKTFYMIFGSKRPPIDLTESRIASNVSPFRHAGNFLGSHNHIDANLKFNNHVSYTYKNQSFKIHCSEALLLYLSFSKFSKL